MPLGGYFGANNIVIAYNTAVKRLPKSLHPSNDEKDRGKHKETKRKRTCCTVVFQRTLITLPCICKDIYNMNLSPRHFLLSLYILNVHHHRVPPKRWNYWITRDSLLAYLNHRINMQGWN